MRTITFHTSSRVVIAKQSIKGSAWQDRSWLWASFEGELKASAKKLLRDAGFLYSSKRSRILGQESWYCADADSKAVSALHSIGFFLVKLHSVAVAESEPKPTNTSKRRKAKGGPTSSKRARARSKKSTTVAQDTTEIVPEPQQQPAPTQQSGVSDDVKEALKKLVAANKLATEATMELIAAL